MKTSIIAGRYADAFFRSLLENEAGETDRKDLSPAAPAGECFGSPTALDSILDHACAQFHEFCHIMEEYPEFPAFFANPTGSEEGKLPILEKACEGMHSAVPTFLKVLMKRKRFNLLPQIVRELRKRFRNHRHIVAVKVVTAIPLLPAERSSLAATLEKHAQGTVEIEEIVDPAVLGGLRIFFQDKVIDDTVATRLKNLREFLGGVQGRWMDQFESQPVSGDI